MGVYCDDATCGVLVEGNVFYRVASYGTVYSNGGHDIVVRNNIFIEGYGPAYQLKSMWYDFGISGDPLLLREGRCLHAPIDAGGEHQGPALQREVSGVEGLA